MKFLLFCEGETEKKALPMFLKRWLDAHLSKPVGIKPVMFVGWKNLYVEAEKKANLRLRESDVIAVISLLDLYGPTFYPEHITTAADRYAWGKQHMEERVGHAKFHQFFAVHEVEAWLLSEPQLFPNEVRNGFPGRVTSPETVNFDEPPARLLGRLYREKKHRTYKHATHGQELFRRLQPETVRSKCPRFAEMLDEMLRLAQEAGL